MDITNALKGKTVMWAATDEKHLVLGTTDGHEVKIKWGEDGPEIVGQAVRIMLGKPVTSITEKGDLCHLRT